MLCVKRWLGCCKSRAPEALIPLCRNATINLEEAINKNSVFKWFSYNFGNKNIIAIMGNNERIIKYFAESSKN